MARVAKQLACRFLASGKEQEEQERKQERKQDQTQETVVLCALHVDECPVQDRRRHPPLSGQATSAPSLQVAEALEPTGSPAGQVRACFNGALGATQHLCPMPIPMPMPNPAMPGPASMRFIVVATWGQVNAAWIVSCSSSCAAGRKPPRASFVSKRAVGCIMAGKGELWQHHIEVGQEGVRSQLPEMCKRRISTASFNNVSFNVTSSLVYCISPTGSRHLSSVTLLGICSIS